VRGNDDRRARRRRLIGAIVVGMSEGLPTKTQEEYRRLLNDNEARLGALYRERRVIMEAFAGDYPVVLPPPRRRSEHQQRVARCPRCGTKQEG
jgi:hypothetical protein